MTSEKNKKSENKLFSLYKKNRIPQSDAFYLGIITSFLRDFNILKIN